MRWREGKKRMGMRIERERETYWLGACVRGQGHGWQSLGVPLVASP